MKTEKKIKISIFIFFLIIVAMVAVAIFPLIGEIKKESQGLAEQKARAASFEQGLETLDVFKDFYKENKDGLEKIESLFIDPEMPVEFIKFLERNAEECQLEISISPASSGKSQDYFSSYINFQILGEGSFQNSLRFLEKLEKSPYLIEVQDLSFGKIESGESSEGETLELIQTSVSFKVYSR